MLETCSASAELVRKIREKSSNFMDGTPVTERVLNAFSQVDRSSFLGESYRHMASLDESIGVGFNQTTSQPSMLAFMFDKLNVSPGERVLEIGTGIGYAAAVISRLCGVKGAVYTIEYISSLAERACKNLKRFSKVTVIKGDGSLGCREHAPFDIIFFSAGIGPEFDFAPLLSQLGPGGRLMIPRRLGELFLFTKGETEITEEVFYSVSFVPLQGKNSGWGAPEPAGNGFQE